MNTNKSGAPMESFVITNVFMKYIQKKAPNSLEMLVQIGQRHIFYMTAWTRTIKCLQHLNKQRTIMAFYVFMAY